MKIFGLRRKSIPKIAVLAAGLAIATMAATIHPAQVAQAFPGYTQICSNCHGTGAVIAATPSSATVAPGASYTVALSPAPDGYWITGNAASVAGGNASSVTMTAPTAPGPYTYNVYVRNGSGGSTTYTITVAEVSAVPEASFTTAPATGVAPLTVAMGDTSTGTPTSWAWDFGNGTTSTVQNPSATYAAAGTYTVSLIATNATGASTPATKTVTVTAAPVAVPVSSFTSSVADLTVGLTDTSSGTPTSWAWDFGNGTTSTLETPSVTYAAAGIYTVTLTASNAGGAGNTASEVITVTAPPVAVPTADFTFAPGTAALSMAMTDSSTGSPTSWAWTFGNGDVSTLQNPTVTYTLVGTYDVTLIATNASGDSTPVTKTITVTAPDPVVVAPVAGFTASATSGTAPLSVTMTDTSTNTPTSWLWDFGNGTTSDVQSPSVTYTLVGTYDVTLTATNSAGTSTSAAQTITVTDGTPSSATITWLSRTHGSVGSYVLIRGTGFGTPGVVTFGTVNARVLFWNAGTIVVKVPTNAVGTTVGVTVTPTGGTASNAVPFLMESGSYWYGDDDHDSDDGDDD